MKDVENLLKQQLKPKRELSSDFTAKTIASLPAKNPHIVKRIGAYMKNYFGQHNIAASFAGIAVVGSTITAIALWPTPNVEHKFTQELPSGNRIVGYSTENCDFRSGLDGRKIKPSSGEIYYEVRKDAKLTDQELQNTLRGLCEEQMSGNTISRIVKTLPRNPSLFNITSTETFTVIAKSANSITLALDPHYNPAEYVWPKEITFTRFASNMVVYNQDTQTTYNDIKVGDSIKLVLKISKEVGRDQPLAPRDPTDNQIVAMLKTPPLTGDPAVFLKSIGKDIVRVEPCDSSPTGFCQVYKFNE